MTTATGGPARVGGLDAIRFLAALSVAVTHMSIAPMALSAGDSMAARLAFGVDRVLFNGHLAVVVFFLLSGYVIHLPHARGKTLRPVEFWVRRLLRILLPLAVAMGLSLACRTRAVYPAWELFIHEPGSWTLRLAESPGIIWSLIAEMVYYAGYPALNRLGSRFGWGAVYAASAVLAMGIGTLHPGAMVYEMPLPAGWLASLPPWVLGCWMADCHARGAAPAVWLRQRTPLRLAVLGCSVAAKLLGPTAGLLGKHAIPMEWILWLFPVVPWICALWLNAEIEGFRQKPPPSWLESLGSWSFSLYLVHVIVRDVWAVYFPDPTAYGTRVLMNLLRLLAALALSYGFARLVEFPSMRLAQWASRQIARPSPQDRVRS